MRFSLSLKNHHIEIFYFFFVKVFFHNNRFYFLTFPFVPFALAVELHLKLNFLTCSLNLNNLSRDAHITVIFQIGERLYSDLEITKFLWYNWWGDRIWFFRSRKLGFAYPSPHVIRGSHGQVIYPLIFFKV